MKDYHVAVAPVGKVTAEEVEAVLSRVAKVLRFPLELKSGLPVPLGVEDTTRRQFRAVNLLTRLRSRVPQLGQGKLVGAESSAEARPRQPDAHIFVTDVDLFTESTDGVFAAFDSQTRTAVVSVRRLREAFYRRKADPTKQRTRLVKEVLRIAGRLRGLKACSDPTCLLSPSKSLIDVDLKEEAYCRVCAEWLFQGTGHI